MNAQMAHEHHEIHEHPDPELKDLPRTWENLGRILVLVPIRVYQRTISRTMPEDTCRFYPTCSHYTYQAIYKYGVIKGGGMGIWRLLRCNPWNRGESYDPVP